MRCEVHGLATGPDGLCALCRAAAAEQSARSARRLGALIVAGLFAVSSALVAAKALLRSVPGTASTVPTVVPEAVEPRAETALEPLDDSPRPAQADQALPEPVASDPPVLEPAPLERLTVPAPTASAPNEAVKEPPSPALIQATLRATPVTMFATSWCPVCSRARAYFDANGISYLERDIDRDPSARAELKQRAGKASVPAFVVDGDFVGPGFAEASMTRVLLASVERRLGVEGLRVVKK